MFSTRVSTNPQLPAKPINNSQPVPIKLPLPPKSPLWGVLGNSVRGPAHVRKGLPNQDVVAWTVALGDNQRLVVAVADGHGSPKCFRSGTGSKLAVEVTSNLLNEFGDAQPPRASINCARWAVHESIPMLLVKRWKEAVNQDRRRNPLTPVELTRLKDGELGLSYREFIKNPHIAYGTTLMAVLVTEAFILYLQIGDGDIINVSDAGRTSRVWLKDPRLIGNHTTSLCQSDPVPDFRSSVIPVAHEPPALILLSTDGYGNAFAKEKDFLQAGPDFLRMIRTNGPHQVQASLRKWLFDTSSEGSGDDASVTVIYRIDQM